LDDLPGVATGLGADFFVAFEFDFEAGFEAGFEVGFGGDF
jgi:hypothetical protein